MTSEWTANTRDCVRGLIGRKVVAISYDQPDGVTTGRSLGAWLLILDDGTGFGFNGAFWRVGEGETSLVVKKRIDELQRLEQEVRFALEQDGIAEE